MNPLTLLKGLGLAIALVALTSAVAQEELTPEQQAEKCAAEGGCAVFTRNEFMSFLRSQFLDGYTQGAKSCTKAI